MRLTTFFLISLLTLSALSTHAQKQEGRVIDEVIAVVGKNAILKSDLENQLIQMRAQGVPVNRQTRYRLFEDQIYQKLLINQAQIDSIEVTEAEVERQLDARIDNFIQRIGSTEQLEEYFGKSILEIKAEFRPVIQEQLLSQRMQGELTGEIFVTPSEVKKYFSSLPQDSLPRIPEKYRIAEVVIKPPVSDEQKQSIRQRLNDYRDRVINGGSNFSTLAVLYSEDPGSARNGGDLGFVTRAGLVPEFAAAAFSLEENEVSRIVETEFGFHIIQLIEKRGERVRVRHILLKPKVTQQARKAAISKLDSISQLIKNDTLSFAQAARRYSIDEYSSVNGGIMMNPSSGETEFKKQDLPPDVAYQMKNLQVGEISKPFESKDDRGNVVYKIILIKEKVKPHVANLDDDYRMIKEMALQNKKEKQIDQWVKQKIKSTYIHIKPPYDQYETHFKKWL